MTPQGKLVFELAVMSQAKYLRDMALFISPESIQSIDGAWEEQKKTLASHFRIWDEPNKPETLASESPVAGSVEIYYPTDEHGNSPELQKWFADMNAVRAKEMERCAKIAETAFDHMSPLAIYETYNADGKHVVRLNPDASARAIARKIRGVE